MTEHEITFYIDGLREKITQRVFSAHEMAHIFGMDPSAIVDSAIEKVVKGPPKLKDKWDLAMAIRAFGPEIYRVQKNATDTAKKTSLKDYPSRIELKVEYRAFVYMDVHDIYRLFLHLNFPGLRKHAVSVQKVCCTTMSIGDSKNDALEMGEDMEPRPKKVPRVSTYTDERREKQRAYYYQNKDVITARARAWRSSNAERVRDYNRSYYHENAEEIKIKKREYNALNSDKIKEYKKTYFQARKMRNQFESVQDASVQED